MGGSGALLALLPHKLPHLLGSSVPAVAEEHQHAVLVAVEGGSVQSVPAVVVGQ